MRVDQERNVVWFDGMRELSDWTEDRNAYSEYVGNSFAGFETRRSLRDKSLSGDSAVVGRATKMMERFMGAIELQSTQLVPEVCGAFPVVPAYLSGEPECFLSPQLASDESKPLRIVVSLGASGRFDASDIETRGAAILALVMALSATRPVTLECVHLACGARKVGPEGRDFFAAAVVRINSSPLDVATAAFALSNAGFYRGMLFGTCPPFFGEMVKGSVNFPRLSLPDGVSWTQQDHPIYIARIVENLGLDPAAEEILYVPSLCSGSESVKACRQPDLWVGQMFDRYRGSHAA